MANFKKYTTICVLETENGDIKKECITLINIEHITACRVVQRCFKGIWTKAVRVMLVNDAAYDVLVPDELQDDLVPDGVVLDKVLGLKQGERRAELTRITSRY